MLTPFFGHVGNSKQIDALGAMIIIVWIHSVSIRIVAKSTPKGSPTMIEVLGMLEYLLSQIFCRV